MGQELIKHRCVILTASDQLTPHRIKDALEFEIESYLMLGRICEDAVEDYEFFINFLPGISNGNHEIISVYLGGKNIGAAFLEKPNIIHRFLVTPKYRPGIAPTLMWECCKWLETDRPKVALLEEQLPNLEEFIQKYNWGESHTVNTKFGKKHFFN